MSGGRSFRIEGLTIVDRGKGMGQRVGGRGWRTQDNFEFRIANLKDKRQEAEGHDAGTRRYGDAETGRNGDAERKAGKLEGR